MKEKVIEILCNVNPQIRNQAEKDLLKTGLIDSFEIVNVVMELEEAFDIEIAPELIIPDNFKDVNAIVNLIEGLTE